jgi:hypothetical protein
MPWELPGNAGTDPTKDFLGTTDNRPLIIRTDGVEQARFETNGYLGLGTTTPRARLSVASGGALINGVSIGIDVPGVNYPYEYETIGVTDTKFNLRLQSPNSIILHTGNPPTERLTINAAGVANIAAGATINGVSVGVDVGGINFPFEYETIGVTSANFNLRLQSPNSIIFHTGNPPTEKVIVTADGDLQLTGADCAERFAVSDSDEIEPGTVLVIGRGGCLEPCHQEYDTRVAGVVSGGSGLKAGIVLGNDARRGSLPVALMGTVFCKVDARETAVEVGDLLTTSATKGHAMRASRSGLGAGTVLGKALSPLRTGLGLIPILVVLQ